MHYVLYLPGVNAANNEALEQVGLPRLVRENDIDPMFSAVLENGPDGGTGTFVHFDPQQRYSPGAYTWTKCPTPGKNFWWGESSEVSTASDLARCEQLPGRRCVLGDQPWLIPNALMLPHDFGLGSDGQPERFITSKYTRLAAQSLNAFAKARELIEQGAGLGPDRAVQFLDYLMMILAENYRVFPEYILSRRLISEENWPRMLMCAIDAQALIKIEEEVLQKKTVSTPPG